MPPEGLHRITEGLRASLHPIDSGATEEVAAASYDSDAAAIFAAFTTPPTTARKGLINTCVLALKTAGIWVKFDLLYIFAAADSQAALINWKNPGTFNGTLVNAPSFTTDRGFVGASTKYIDSTFNPTTAPSPKFVRDSATIIGWAVVAGAAANVGFVGMGSSVVIQMVPQVSGGANCAYEVNAAGSSLAAVSGGLGLHSASRSAASGAGAVTMYKNGTSIGSTTAASVAVVSDTINFLRRTTGYWTGTMGVGGVGQSLGSTEQTDLYNALFAYLNAVGAA